MKQGAAVVISGLKERYEKEAIGQLMSRFGYKNRMEVPRLERVVINVGAGEAKENAKFLDAVVKEITRITGQRPMVTRAKKSIAAFKIREGMTIGCKATLRRRRMYDFLDRLLHMALPRIRDFRGISQNSFDGRGNYTLGLKEQVIFPEIPYDEISAVHGMDITIVTTARTNEEGLELLKSLGFPFRKQEKG